MVGIINKIYTYISPEMERHPVHDILGTNLYHEAKAIVQDKIDNSDNVLEKLKVLELSMDA
jgi:hypothetical protein